MNVTIKVDDDLYQRARAIAAEEHSSVELLIQSALEREIGDLERLQSKASKGSRERFKLALAKVPQVAPDPDDEL